jgi:glycosyltransferase involved in cell wall biosynthesis
LANQKITALIIAFNEEKNLRDCLGSIKWVDEIIVIDSFSTDKTVEIAKEFTDKVIQRKWEGFASQRKFSLRQATNDWILSLDADERITNELKSSIQKVLAGDSPVDGYKIARRNYFLGKWIESAFWYPDYQMRLFRKSRARMDDKLIHEGFEIDGKVGILEGDIIHYSYQSLQEAISKINNYSSLAAKQKEDKKVGAVDIVFRPLSAFITDFFSRKGYRDGFYGFLVAGMNAMTTLMTYTKIWERQRAKLGK